MRSAEIFLNFHKRGFFKFRKNLQGVETEAPFPAMMKSLEMIFNQLVNLPRFRVERKVERR